MTRKPRVYVAGKLNAMAVDYIVNIHRMITVAIEVRRAGFAVFVPCLDVLMGFVAGDMDYGDYFENSQPWLSASEAVYVCPGWETSEGTKREIARAQGYGIPVFYDLNTMRKYFSETEKKGE